MNTVPTIAVSTAWNALRHENGESMVNEFLELGFNRLELNVHVTPSMIEEIRGMVSEGRVCISSLHNYCPLPDGVQRIKAASNPVDLACLDGARRAAAVAHTKHTIDWAVKLGAKVVVVHLGSVPVMVHQREAIRLIQADRLDEARELVFNDLSLRANERMPYIDCAMASLKELAPYAEDAEIKLGLETRYYYSEIPSLDEFRMFFGNIRSSALGYWHDTGHADTMEALGVANQIDYLNKYSEKLLGMHIHDAEIGSDHRAIGNGNIDFSLLRPYIKPETHMVLEIHKQATAEELVQSRDAIVQMLETDE